MVILIGLHVFSLFLMYEAASNKTAVALPPQILQTAGQVPHMLVSGKTFSLIVVTVLLTSKQGVAVVCNPQGLWAMLLLGVVPVFFHAALIFFYVRQNVLLFFVKQHFTTKLLEKKIAVN